MLRSWGNQQHPWSAAPAGSAAFDPDEITEEVIDHYYKASMSGQMQPRDGLLPDHTTSFTAVMDKKATLCLLMEAFM